VQIYFSAFIRNQEVPATPTGEQEESFRRIILIDDD
jgi:hypothetical protein